VTASLTAAALALGPENASAAERSTAGCGSVDRSDGLQDHWTTHEDDVRLPSRLPTHDVQTGRNRAWSLPRLEWAAR
jgi:hypothetical protein